MSQPPVELTFRALAKALGLDRRGVARDCKRGMPRDVEGALAWRMAYVRPQKGTPRPTIAEAQARVTPREVTPPKVVAFDYANAPVVDVEEPQEDLAVCVKRLRRLEATCVQELERMLREGRVSEAQALRREHSSMIKSLFDASSKLLKLEEARGKLVTLDRALSMISEALSEPVVLLRQLPSIGKDEAERARLQAIVEGILEAIQRGAARGLEQSASSGREYSF